MHKRQLLGRSCQDCSAAAWATPGLPGAPLGYLGSLRRNLFGLEFSPTPKASVSTFSVQKGWLRHKTRPHLEGA